MGKLEIKQIKTLDGAQLHYRDWRKTIHLYETEDRSSIFQGFRNELMELREELENPKKNRINIAGEAADILLYSMALLDHENQLFSSLYSNGKTVELFSELQELSKSRIKEKKWTSPDEVFEKIQKDTDTIEIVISNHSSSLNPSLREIVLDSSSLIVMLGLPVGRIVSGKLSRNENKYPRDQFTFESLSQDYNVPLGLVGQSLQELVKRRQVDLKDLWNKELDVKYLTSALGPAFGLHSIATAFLPFMQKILPNPQRSESN